MSLLNLPYLMMARVAGGEGGNPLNHLVDHILDHELGWAPHPFLTKHRFIIMLAAVLLIVFLVPICSRSVARSSDLKNTPHRVLKFVASCEACFVPIGIEFHLSKQHTGYSAATKKSRTRN